MRLATLVEQLLSIQRSYIALARLYSLVLIGDKQITGKSSAASAAYRAIELASYVEDFLHRFFQQKRLSVIWELFHASTIEEIVSEAGIIQQAVCFEIANAQANLLSLTENMLGETAASGVLSPVRSLLTALSNLSDFPAESTATAPELHHRRVAQGTPRSSTEDIQRVCHGPKKLDLDPHFVPSYSLLVQSPPSFSDSERETIPYLWTLAMREAMAANACALSVVEYDGLPLAFYRDMIKQMWDEARHAGLFLNIAIDLLPALRLTLCADDPLTNHIDGFFSRSQGLPVPIEQSLYDAVWNADLAERLILLQVQTEGAAVRELKNKLCSPLCEKFPALSDAFAVDDDDEISHASIGNRWLHFLIPAQDELRDKIETANLLRGVFILAGCSNSNRIPLPDLLDTYSHGASLPT